MRFEERGAGAELDNILEIKVQLQLQLMIDDAMKNIIWRSET